MNSSKNLPDGPAPSALRQAVVDATVEKLNAKLNDKVVKTSDKVARKAAKHLEHLDRLANHLEVLEIWTRAEPGTRRPRFTRDEIASTAIRIADAEGFEAVSMRRIASELDAGTMTLYHYVRTKDELLTLVTDTMMGELVVPADEMPTEWRAAVTALANRSLSVLRRHPWVLDIADDPNIGPNSVRHFDQSLQAVASLNVDLALKLDIITVVDEYVFGYCQHQRTNLHEDGHLATIPDEVVRYVEELTAAGDYPQLRELIDEHGSNGSWASIFAHAGDTTRFERNLSRILDGFQAEIDRVTTANG